MLSMEESSNPYDSAMALASLDAARADLAERLKQGAWRYDLIYSLLSGLAVGVCALPEPFNLAGAAVAATSMTLLQRDYARRTGILVCAASPRRARWATIGLALAIVALCITTFLAAGQGHRWVGLPAAGLAIVAAVAGSKAWRLLYRRDLMDPQAISQRPLGVFLALGLAATAVSVGLYLLRADSGYIGIFIGVGASLSIMSGLFFWRRRLGAAR